MTKYHFSLHTISILYFSVLVLYKFQQSGRNIGFEPNQKLQEYSSRKISASLDDNGRGMQPCFTVFATTYEFCVSLLPSILSRVISFFNACLFGLVGNGDSVAFISVVHVTIFFSLLRRHKRHNVSQCQDSQAFNLHGKLIFLASSNIVDF
ncbi:hypothetical protein NC653_041244 [Populus alba x Populus x berolinensis]|uniref:Uncharacterized protein n=1 Tax=Populus alba x Populus x berolinensis TaxID=444605 RepID=A0AAD6PPP4_9ROSI|nr:hypothetical protein NC653_041244 [Populus alba x Populus x berolinensis]